MSDKRANDLNLFTKDQDNYSIDTSKKLKVGIIGTGWIAESHISEYLKMPDVELVGVADLVDGKAEKFLRKWNAPEGVRVYHSHKELIDNEKLDAVSVCTYNMTHAECTIYALDHGVNVLLEKPMCVTLEEAVEIRKAEKRNGKIVSVGFQPRYNPNMQMIKYIIESGELGKVYHIQIGGGRRRGIPTPFGTTFIEKETGGIGALGDIGCYALNINPPFSVTHTQIDMGGSITAGHGFERVERFAQRGLKVFSFIGDSTFFHSGITGLINAVYNGAKTSIFILDNSTTGMTGHQDNPVTGVTLMKDVTTAVDIKTLVLGCGVKPENVRTVDPYDLKATAAVVKEAYEAEDLFVVIVRQPCALLKSVIAHRKGQHCRVNADKCRSCKVCINKTACPALTVGENGVSISTEDCNGCTICQQICPFGTIEKEGE